MEPRFCMQCGSKLQPGQRFCDQCGLVIPDDLTIQSGIGRTPVPPISTNIQTQPTSDTRFNQNETDQEFQRKQKEQGGSTSYISHKNTKSDTKKPDTPQSEKKYRLPGKEKSYTPPVEKKYRLPSEQTPGSREQKVPPVRDRRVPKKEHFDTKRENTTGKPAESAPSYSSKGPKRSPLQVEGPDKKTRISDVKGSGYISSAYRHLDLDDLRLSPLFPYYRAAIIISIIAIIIAACGFIWINYGEDQTIQNQSGQDIITPISTLAINDTKPLTIEEIVGEYNDKEQNLTLIEVRLTVGQTKSPFTLTPEDTITVTINDTDPVSLMTPEKTTLNPGTSKVFGWDISALNAKPGDQINLTITTDTGEKISSSRKIPEDYQGGPIYESEPSMPASP